MGAILPTTNIKQKVPGLTQELRGVRPETKRLRHGKDLNTNIKLLAIIHYGLAL